MKPKGSPARRSTSVTPGGATAFSTNSTTMSFIIKQAPSWTAAAGAGLTPIAPGTYLVTNTGTPAGNSVASVFGSFFHDANQAVTVGVAVVGLTGNGAWQYSTNFASTWTNFPAVSTTSALLLSSSDEVRFVPKTTAAATGTLVARALGRQHRHGCPKGQSGSGRRRLRVQRDDLDRRRRRQSRAEFERRPRERAGHRRRYDQQPDHRRQPPRASRLQRSRRPQCAARHRNHQRGLERGLRPIHACGRHVAGRCRAFPWPRRLLLPSTASLRFVANNQLGSATLTFRGWDQTQGAAGQTFNITAGGFTAFSTVSSILTLNVKQAPSWSATKGAALNALLPGSYSISSPSTPAGDTVASVFSSFFHDINPGVTVGIAVSSMAGNGTWQYATTAGTWLNITAPSTTNALLLSGTDMIRFVPKTTAAGTATLAAYAWDGSVGTHGNIANPRAARHRRRCCRLQRATTLTAACVVNTALRC